MHDELASQYLPSTFPLPSQYLPSTFPVPSVCLTDSMHDELASRMTFENGGHIEMGPSACCSADVPRNPRGRTGMAGRGLLGRWGPNHAADPIITRWNAATEELEVVAVQRKDTGEWALPGGMVAAGEVVPAVIKKELREV